jgi:stage V sporulation protein R
MLAEKTTELLFSAGEWRFDTLKRTYDAIEQIAIGEMGLDPYPNQIELISAEQMLDAYSSNGVPIIYNHWSFGKRFAMDEKMYRKGYTGLAYEIVINSNPCISYIMEENTMTMQALVMVFSSMM